MSTAARLKLLAFDWPGNVRQLRNVIESMVVVDYDGVLGPGRSADGIGRPAGGRRPKPSTGSIASLVGKPLGEVEKLFIAETLNNSPAATANTPPNAGHRRTNPVPQNQRIRPVSMLSYYFVRHQPLATFCHP